MPYEIVKLRIAGSRKAFILTLPVEVQREFGFENGDHFYVVTTHDGRIVYQKVPDMPATPLITRARASESSKLMTKEATKQE